MYTHTRDDTYIIKYNNMRYEKLDPNEQRKLDIQRAKSDETLMYDGARIDELEVRGGDNKAKIFDLQAKYRGKPQAFAESPDERLHEEGERAIRFLKMIESVEFQDELLSFEEDVKSRGIMYNKINNAFRYGCDSIFKSISDSGEREANTPIDKKMFVAFSAEEWREAIVITQKFLKILETYGLQVPGVKKDERTDEHFLFLHYNAHELADTLRQAIDSATYRAQKTLGRIN
jgi:hypothetical protein